MNKIPLGNSTSLRLAIYHGLPAGGAKRTAFEHARGLSQRHAIAFFSLGSTDDNFCDIRPFAIESQVVPFEPWPLFRSPLGRLNQAIRMADLLRLRRASQRMAADINQANFDVILVHPCQHAGTPWLLQFLRRPTVYYIQEHNRAVHERPPSRPYMQRSRWKQGLDKSDLLNNSYYRLLARIEGQGLQHADCVLVNSKYIQSELYRVYHIDSAVCYHGVDIVAFSPRRLPRDNMVLSVGMLAPRKGFDFIIEGLARIPAFSRPRLVLVGCQQIPAERFYLEALAASRGVEVNFLTMVDHETLVELYNRAMLTIYTPVKEPFGLVPLESMACGTPVIGIAEGGVRETVLDGITGRLVTRDPDVLAAAMVELIGKPELRAEMGQAGRRYVEREWTWERAISTLEQHLYETAQVG